MGKVIIPAVMSLTAHSAALAALGGARPSRVAVAPGMPLDAAAISMESTVRALLAQSPLFRNPNLALSPAPFDFQPALTDGKAVAYHVSGTYTFKGRGLEGDQIARTDTLSFYYVPNQDWRFGMVDSMGGSPPKIQQLRLGRPDAGGAA